MAKATSAPRFAEGYKGAKIPLVGTEIGGWLPSIYLRDFLFNLIDFNSELPKDQRGGTRTYNAELFFRTASHSTPLLVVRGIKTYISEAERSLNRESAVRGSRMAMQGPNSSDRPGPVYYRTGEERLVVGKPPAEVGILQPVVSYEEDFYGGEYVPWLDSVRMEYLGQDITKRAFMKDDYSDEAHERAEQLQADKVLKVATHIAQLLGSEEFN